MKPNKFFIFHLLFFQISAQESRRKKKEYVDALEKEIAKYVDENKALKDRMATIEKNQK
jgi:cell division protein FtsB